MALRRTAAAAARAIEKDANGVIDTLIDGRFIRFATFADQEPHLQFGDRHVEKHLGSRGRIGDVQNAALVLQREPRGERRADLGRAFAMEGVRELGCTLGFGDCQAVKRRLPRGQDEARDLSQISAEHVLGRERLVRALALVALELLGAALTLQGDFDRAREALAFRRWVKGVVVAWVVAAVGDRGVCGDRVWCA